MRSFVLIYVVLPGLILCGGCNNWDKYPFKGVTPIPPSAAAETTQGKGWEHLQGGSLEADHQAALQANRRLKEVPECSNYTLQVLGCLNPGAYTNCPIGTTFRLRIEIYQDGSIGNVSVDGWTDAVRTPLFIQAIEMSHFPKWPDAMRSIVGRDYFIMWIDTGCPYPPGPS
jgi:hypothetical protein